MGEGHLWLHCRQWILYPGRTVLSLVDEARTVQIQLPGITEKVFGLGEVSRSVRDETPRQYQHPPVHDVSVFCGECVAGDARQAFLASGIHDQICLGNTMV